MDTTYYTTYDLPFIYRNIKIYPITVKDYLLFNIYSQCLTIDKNSIPDPKIISMTYLEYMFRTTEENPTDFPYLIWFDRLLALCLKEDDTFTKIEESIKRYRYDEDTGKPYFTIKEEIYTPDDFDKIKEIIAEQNLVELIDENVSKEVRDSMEKAREFKRKLSGEASASTEDYIIALSIATGSTLDYIYSMTIRKFIKSIRSMDKLIHYKIFLASSMSGMVEFKDKSFIKHWLTGSDDENKYGDVTVDLQEMQDKVSFESAKK
jgi:hypothetical protein